MIKYLFYGLLMIGGFASCQSGGSGMHAFSNHLVGERSPYLLQHAHNPVDWYPWGDEALGKAQKEQKLLVVSIGYAACHWCHVMEKESFMDTTVARMMNQHFVSIKVDREERPDIDDVYMTACQLSTDRGCGWPLNVFALPDGQPVWAGTYFPKNEWLRVLDYFVTLWETEPEKLKQYASQLVDEMEGSVFDPIPESDSFLQEETLQRAVAQFLEGQDLARGGSKGTIKFPMPTRYAFLQGWHFYAEDQQALEAVRVTLRALADGGIYDQLGGGFARYSTDEKWLVPHFEKMLYDNAQLVSLYANAYRLEPTPLYKEVVLESIGFLERELQGRNGGFYSSLDADSEGEEGAYYVWEAAAIDSLLSDPALAKLLKTHYGVSDKGNWEKGKNVLHRAESLEALAMQRGEPVAAIRERINQARSKLLEARKKRPAPGLDDKMLTSWNALMLQGYLDAYAAFGEERFLEKARGIAGFIEKNMMQKDGRLNRNYMDGKSGINGFLDDYALTIQAYISLYQATFEEKWLFEARKLANYALEHFSEEETGLFFYTSDLDPPLVVRKKEVEDNVIPASNSVMARSLWRLGHFLEDSVYTLRSERMLKSAWPQVTATGDPAFFANWCQLFLDQLHPPYEVVILGPEAADFRQQMQADYRPNVFFLGGEAEGNLPLLKNRWREDGTWIYVCRNKICKLPVDEVEAALEQLAER